jgi:hypothetical protein
MSKVLTTLTIAVVVGVTTLAAPLRAQVGHRPETSPYKDLERTHELTLVFGSFQGTKDPAGVAPRDGIFSGVQYEWRGTGPLHLAVEAARIGSRRTVIDPTQPAQTRTIADASWPLYAIDGSLAVSLTGRKSWHGLVPMAKGGVGFVADLKRGTDLGGFTFGTRFAFVAGTGMRWVPGGKFQLRADLTDRMYTIAYPGAYYDGTEDATPVLSSTTSKSRWTHNLAYTFGITYFLGK